VCRARYVPRAVGEVRAALPPDEARARALEASPNYERIHHPHTQIGPRGTLRTAMARSMALLCLAAACFAAVAQAQGARYKISYEPGANGKVGAATRAGGEKCDRW
jgi:hypothetical protein